MPAAAIVISITRLTRSWPSDSEVRLVDSFSGSIGKICAAVYTDVVFARAWSSIGEPIFTMASTSGDGHENLRRAARKRLATES